MIAHSFTGAVFGPAQKLHGATYVIDVEFRRPELDADSIVVDIGRASEALRGILAGLNYSNLDNDPSFTGRNTTTEFLARYVFEQIAGMARSGSIGRQGRELAAIRVTSRSPFPARERACSGVPCRRLATREDMTWGRWETSAASRFEAAFTFPPISRIHSTTNAPSSKAT